MEKGGQLDCPPGDALAHGTLILLTCSTALFTLLRRKEQAPRRRNGGRLRGLPRGSPRLATDLAAGVPNRTRGTTLSGSPPPRACMEFGWRDVSYLRSEDEYGVWVSGRPPTLFAYCFGVPAVPASKKQRDFYTWRSPPLPSLLLTLL